MAQTSAAGPNPCPGSDRTIALSGSPLAVTTTRRITVCSSICSAAASRVQGQDQLSVPRDTGLERSTATDEVGSPELGTVAACSTAEVAVPFEAVSPPAYAVAVPVTTASAVRSTGELLSGVWVTTVAA